MPVLKNPRHERFAQLRASGKSGFESYRIVAGKNARNADVRADELTSRPDVRERIEELQAEAAKHCRLTREQFVESLVEMYRGKPGEATLDNPLCEEVNYGHRTRT
jgi:phage terminase small subunit